MENLESGRGKRRYSDSRYPLSRRDENREPKHGLKHIIEPGEKRARHNNIPRRTPARSDWDGGRSEWEDTPHQVGRSMTGRHHHPSPSPMLAVASPDARLVSPWLGGHTPCSAVSVASPWDCASPAPVPVRACGASRRTAISHQSRRFHQLTFSASGFETRKDGIPMTLAQSKKMSQLRADNTRWEDRQLLRSGAVRGTELQIDFEDEDEHKMTLLVYGVCISWPAGFISEQYPSPFQGFLASSWIG